MFGSEKLIESERAKAAFRESEEHYRAVTDAATDAIITIDSYSTILIVNPAAERIFGYSTKELIGQPLTMLMPEYLRHLHKAGITRSWKLAGSILGGQPFNCPACIRAALRFHLKSHLQNSPKMASASSRLVAKSKVLLAAIDSALKAEDHLLNSPITMKNIEPPTREEL